MKRSIAILRGINVGGKRKILMKELKSMFENIGFLNVLTYIQSGNVLFDCPENLQTQPLSETLEKAILDTFGFDVPVIIRTKQALEEAIAKNPYFTEDADINRLHLTFLDQEPTPENCQKISSQSFEPDAFKIHEKDVFINCTGKYHQSKLTNTFFEKKLQVRATTRNWKTVLQLQQLA